MSPYSTHSLVFFDWPPWVGSCPSMSIELGKPGDSLLGVGPSFLFVWFVFSSQGFSVYPWLSWNSFCRLVWPQTQRTTCFLSAGIKGEPPCPAKRRLISQGTLSCAHFCEEQPETSCSFSPSTADELVCLITSCAGCGVRKRGAKSLVSPYTL